MHLHAPRFSARCRYGCCRFQMQVFDGVITRGVGVKCLSGGMLLISVMALAGCGVFVPTRSEGGDFCPANSQTNSSGCTFDDDCPVGEYCYLDSGSCCPKVSCASSDECAEGLWCVRDERLGSACKLPEDCSQVVDAPDAYCMQMLDVSEGGEATCDMDASPAECVLTTP